MIEQKKFFRATNIFRLIGLAMVIAGSFLPSSAFSGFGFSIQTNLVQLIGALFAAWPLIRELKK